MYLNQITIIGNVTRDPETKETTTGGQRTVFGVAVDAGKDQVDYFNVVQFDKPWPDDMLKKGSLVLVQGAMRSRRTEDGVYWAINANQVLVLNAKTGSRNNKKRED